MKRHERRIVLEDTEIVDLFFARDEAAIDNCRVKFGALLQRLSFNILGIDEDAEECVSDTYIKAWDSIPPQKPVSLTAYLCRIARNLSINKFREKKAQKRGGGKDMLLSELCDCVPDPSGVEQELDSKELGALINGFLTSLDEDDRNLFLRRYFFAESLNVLAFECGMTPKQLASRMFLLRRKLRTQLEKEGVSI